MLQEPPPGRPFRHDVADDPRRPYMEKVIEPEEVLEDGVDDPSLLAAEDGTGPV